PGLPLYGPRFSPPPPAFLHRNRQPRLKSRRLMSISSQRRLCTSCSGRSSSPAQHASKRGTVKEIPVGQPTRTSTTRNPSVAMVLAHHLRTSLTLYLPVLSERPSSTLATSVGAASTYWRN
ncbi:hypothetical protein FS837_006077, partial [Tulasnella sp. UAMH 9824]